MKTWNSPLDHNVGDPTFSISVTVSQCTVYTYAINRMASVHLLGLRYSLFDTSYKMKVGDFLLLDLQCADPAAILRSLDFSDIMARN